MEEAVNLLNKGASLSIINTRLYKASGFRAALSK
jgi:hypothetical protein